MGLESPICIIRAIGNPDLLAFFGFLLSLLATVHALETLIQLGNDRHANRPFEGAFHDGGNPDREN